MIAAFGFVPNNAGFGTALVENSDIDAARAALEEVHGRKDFVRIIILSSSAPISLVGNWAAPFDLKTATLDQIANIIDGGTP